MTGSDGWSAEEHLATPGHASDLGLFENAIQPQNVIYIIYISIYWFVSVCLFIDVVYLQGRW
jgi:hypothetical protein